PQARFREDYDPSLPPVAGERDALVQLFLNLVKNAVEATDRKGQIVLTTAYRHGVRVAGRSLPIEACVLDDGPGAPETVAGRLFEPFVSTKPTGGGLGLAMVAKIAADHGAAVDHARVGRHTRLRVRFAAAGGAGEER
ncbi:MAG: ATP-binding protein, partial [Sphingomonadaceae bacterium]